MGQRQDFNQGNPLDPYESRQMGPQSRQTASQLRQMGAQPPDQGPQSRQRGPQSRQHGSQPLGDSVATARVATQGPAVPANGTRPHATNGTPMDNRTRASALRGGSPRMPPGAKRVAMVDAQSDDDCYLINGAS